MAKISKPEAPAAKARPYIKSVRLRDYRSLRDVKATFKPGLNIIIGKNGSGKTNFLGLLGELAEPMQEKYDGVGCEIELGGVQDIAVVFNEPKSKTDLLQAKHHFSYVLPKPVPLIATARSAREEDEDVFLLEALRQVIEEPDSFFYKIVRIGHGLPRYQLPILEVDADVVISYGAEGRATMMLLNAEKPWFTVARDNELLANIFVFLLLGLRLKNLGETSNTTPDLELVRQQVLRSVTRQLQRLNTRFSLYSPLQEVRCGEQLRVYWNSEKKELTVKGLVLEYRIENDWLPFQALSDGTKRVFFILSKLLAEDAIDVAIERPETTKIIFLEEPELGIHPEQLHKLMQLIREVSRENQVILTTHSPQVLDVLTEKELDRITICEYVPGKGTQMRKLSAAKRKKAQFYLRDKGFLSEFWRFSNLEDPD